MPRIREYNFARFAKRTQSQVAHDQPHLLALDTETDGAAYHAVPFCVTATWRGKDDRLRNGYFELGDIDFAEELVKDMLTAHHARGGELIFHNAKFDLEKMAVGGMIDLCRWDPHRIHDTEAIWHLLHPHDLKSLDYLTPHRLGKSKAMVKIQSGKRKGELRLVSASKLRLKQALKDHGMKAEDGFHLLPREVLAPYAMEDTRYTYMLFELGYPQLKDGNLEAYRMEQEVSAALIHMESAGMKLDLPYLEKTTSEFGIKIMESEAQIRAMGGEKLNPNAPAQILKALEERGHKTKSTDKKHLRRIDDDLAREVLNHRYLTKVHGDKLRPLLNEQRDGIIHPWIRQHGAVTGRTASGAAKIDG